MISFEQWKEMSAKRRQKWLSRVDSEDADEEDRELLSNIADPLRRIDFELVEGWERIQNVYEKRPMRWSSSTRTSLDLDVRTSIKDIKEKLDRNMTEMEKVNEQLEKLRLENQE